MECEIRQRLGYEWKAQLVWISDLFPNKGEMQMRKHFLGMVFIQLFALFVSAADSSPASVAKTFCTMELDGVTLSGESSQSAWALTSGEEEPFMGGEEIATTCNVSGEKLATPSHSIVTIQYQVIGRLAETPDGSRRVVKVKQLRKTRITLTRSPEGWRISKKSLMNEPVRATPAAWATHFQRLIEKDAAKRTKLDNELEALVKELKDM